MMIRRQLYSVGLYIWRREDQRYIMMESVLNLTHPRVLLGAIRDDFHMVSIHIVAEEVIEVGL